MPAFHDWVNTKSFLATFTIIDMMRGRKSISYTSLLSECPNGNHNKCKIFYYNKYKKTRRMS